MDAQPDVAVEEVPISLFDTVVLAARSTDGSLWLSVNDLALAVNVDPRSQRRRLQANVILRRRVRSFRTSTAGGAQVQLFLQLEGVGLWVMTLNTAKVSDAIRDRLIWLQEHLEQAVRKAFAAATGLPERSSDIEDIDDLGQMDTILQSLAQQQSALAQTQESLARTVAELSARVRALEATRQEEAPPISRAQRGQLYDLILQWSTQLQARNEGMSIGSARATCWAAFKRRFKLAEYHHLPAAQYEAAVAFVRAAYQELGGGDLPTQTSFDLGAQ